MGRVRVAICAAVVGCSATAVFVAGAGAASGVATQSFASCDEAAAAGYSDISSSDPGYSTALDADKDGVACDATAAPVVMPEAAPAPAPPAAVAPPAAAPEVLAATAAAPQATLAHTGVSSWVLLGVAMMLFLAGKRLMGTGYELLAWVPGRRHSEVRYTIERRRRRRGRR